MANRKLIVEVVGDSSSLERSFARSTAASKTFEKGTTGSLSRVDKAFTRSQKLFAGGFAGGVAAGVAIKAVGDLTSAASDLNEQITKSNQVFGKSASSITDWSSTTAKALGISKTAALEAAGTFGNLFAAIGLSESVSAGTSKQLVQLASDLASFNNVDPSDVLTALRSGIVGEIEPLRRFGVQLSAARVEQEALAETGKDSVKQLTDQEKVLARVELIMRDTTKAQGDFARTSEGLANQQRILKAQWADMSAELGTNLLPVMVRGAEIANDFFDALHPPATATDLIGQDFRNKFADAFGMDALKDFLRQLAPQIREASAELQTTLEPAFGLNQSLQDMLQGKGQGKAGGGLTDPSLFAKLPGVDTGSGIADAFGKSIDKFIETARAKAQDAIRRGREAIAKDTAATAKANQRKAFDSLLAAIGLQVDTAATTKGFADDLRRNTQLQAAIQKQIQVEGKTTELESELLAAREARANILGSKAQAAAEAQRKAQEAIQAAQFQALGLDREGNKPPPAIANLKKQLQQLSSRDDLTGADKGILARIRKVLVDPIHKATPETRDAIKSLFDTIRQEFDKGAKDATGPLTKTTSLNANKLLEGLGLGRDMEKELRARLSSVNSAGVSLSGTRRPTGGFVGGQQPVVVEAHTTVHLDGDVVGRSVTKTQQKNKRRNTTQKRGPNSGV